MPDVRLRQNTLGSDIILDREKLSSSIDIWLYQGILNTNDIILQRQIGIVGFIYEEFPSSSIPVIMRIYRNLRS